jgi:hypothetical protein
VSPNLHPEQISPFWFFQTLVRYVANKDRHIFIDGFAIVFVRDILTAESKLLCCPLGAISIIHRHVEQLLKNTSTGFSGGAYITVLEVRKYMSTGQVKGAELLRILLWRVPLIGQQSP